MCRHGTRLRGVPSGYLADDVPAPASLRLQLNALQSLCRQTIAVRLAALVVGTPFAMAGAADGAPRHAVLIAAVLAITGSYAMLRDWDRFGPRLLAHPTLMALDLVLGAVLLLTASPASPLAYATVCTPLLAGLLYGWRGSGVFTGLQLTVLLTVYRAWEHRPGAGTNTVLILGFCAGAGIIGVTLRNLLFRFGAATEALAEATSRLAVAEAVETERARLARELHDSVAKTLHGLALTADALSASAARSADPAVLQRQAELVASAARRAAGESRDLLSDLRRHTDLTGTPGVSGATGTDLGTALSRLTEDFTARTAAQVRLGRTHPSPSAPSPPLPTETGDHLLAIVAEALENAHRHARATEVVVEAWTHAGTLHLTVTDDGVGLPPGLTPLTAARAGHFGLLGMTERARTIGARLSFPHPPTGGTSIEVTLPLPLPNAPREEAAHA
ncbi:ATPase [Streptomyces ruber]|uniref:ATPase n=2 Tax=Streptomyces TaxID=1883 RepID=A0A918B7C6_9ACTN|nr:ATPase [Streptomyces ruber]